MAMLFVLVMAVLAVLVLTTSEEGGESQLLIRLAIAAIALPIAMAALINRILAPAAHLESATDELRTMYSQARLDALLDPITGLGNHRAFQEELHRQIEDAHRHNHPLALALFDLDDLKRVNDEHGHAGGDQLLGSMGRLLVAASRAADRGFRIGGDEFALLLPHSDAPAAHAVVHRMLADALSAQTTFGRTFSFSAGISAYPEPSRDGRRLLRNADAALYWAKRHGRTDVQVFDPNRHGVSDDSRTTPELAEALDRLTEDGAMTPVFQPIYDLATGKPVGFEGLVRPTELATFRDATALFTAAEVADRTVEMDMLADPDHCLRTGRPSAGRPIPQRQRLAAFAGNGPVQRLGAGGRAGNLWPHSRPGDRRAHGARGHRRHGSAPLEPAGLPGGRLPHSCR